MRAIIATLIRTYEQGVIDQNFKGNFFEDKLALLIFLLVSVSVLSYVVGSVNFAVIISKKLGGDIREVGSGNAGATNMTRTYGKKIGALTLVLDALKTAVVCIIGIVIYGSFGGFLAGLFCIIGHAFPVFFNFRGGKGVSCMAAMVFVTSPVVFLIMLPIFLIVLFGFKMVSFASVMASITYPLFLSMVHGYGLEIILALLCSALIVFLHRQNLSRIFNHTEPKINLFNKKQKKIKVVEELLDDENSEE